jgi:hypothetical protein
MEQYRHQLTTASAPRDRISKPLYPAGRVSRAEIGPEVLPEVRLGTLGLSAAQRALHALSGRVREIASLSDR